MVPGRGEAVNGARVDASLQLCKNTRVGLKIIAQIGTGKGVLGFIIVSADPLYHKGRVVLA